MKQKVNLSLLYILLLIVWSCEENDPTPDQDLNSKIYSNQAATVNLESDDFNLYEVTLENGILKLDVGYSGGCEEHEFTIVWPEVITAIYPPEFDIYVIHDSNGDMCEAYPRETLEINIENNPLQIDLQTLSIMKLGVVNASNPDQTFYPND